MEIGLELSNQSDGEESQISNPKSKISWQVVAASVMGTSHEKRSQPCQDAHCWRLLPNGVLAAGQSVLLSTRQIDAAIGAAPSGFTSGRIRFTAPTNGLRVQSLLQNIAGNAPPVEYKNPASECRTTGGGGTVPAVVGGAAPASTIASVSTTCTPSSN